MSQKQYVVAGAFARISRAVPELRTGPTPVRRHDLETGRLSRVGVSGDHLFHRSDRRRRRALSLDSGTPTRARMSSNCIHEQLILVVGEERRRSSRRGDRPGTQRSAKPAPLAIHAMVLMRFLSSGGQIHADDECVAFGLRPNPGSIA